MSDLQATGTNPGTEYLPAIGPPTAPYNEDRQVTLTGGPGTQMYRTVNAYFDQTSQTWKPVTSAPAYSTVQNPDGSIHYYTLNSSGTWIGSGDNAVYNAVDYGLVEGAGKSPTVRAANVAAIQSAVNAAIAKVVPGKSNGGGTVVIPAGVYELGGTISPIATATIIVTNVTGGLTIRGESAGTTLIQYGTPPSGTGASAAADIFDVSSSGSANQVGIRFRDLTLQYAAGLSVPTSGAVAINLFDTVSDTSAENCGFVNCPQAFAAGSSGKTGHSGLVGCTVSQNDYSNAAQVLLSGPECFVLYSELYQTNTSLTGTTGITVQGAAEGCRIYGCHISDFYTGISVAQGAVFTYITDCEVDAFQGLTIAPAVDGGQIYGVFVTACKFAMIENTAASSATWGIYIDTAGGINTYVEGICIADCLVFGYQNAGLQINRGQSISVTGGKYSSNGQSSLTVELAAGIAITGPCADVRIVGADCSGVFNFWPNVQNPSPGSPPVTQPYGISVVSGVTAVCVADCNLMNNETAALYVPTAGTDLRVNDCAGYNDQRTSLNDELAPESEVGAFNCTTPYYGPSVVTFSNPSNLEVYASGVTNFMSFGSLFLSHASDLISFSGQPSSSFAWIGK
jgi:hypothetical protein